MKIGKCHFELKDYTSAIEVLMIAYTFDMSRSDVRILLAESYRLNGQLEIATQLASEAEIMVEDKSLDLNPERIFEEVFGSPCHIGFLYGINPEGNQSDEGLDISDILRLPNIGSKRKKHPALRQVRRRPRKIVQVRFTDAQIESTQSAFKRCLIFYEHFIESLDSSIATSFLKLSTPLIEEDLSTNNYLRSDDKFRRITPEVRQDIAALHGLTVEQWLSFLMMHAIVLARTDSSDRAIKLIRAFYHQSAFALEPPMAASLRLLQTGLTLNAGKNVGALIGTRWFLTELPNRYGPLLIIALACPQNIPGASDVLVDSRLSRPLARNSQVHPSNIGYQYYPAHSAFIRAYYEEAYKLYCKSYSMLKAITTGPLSMIRLRLYMAVCLVESSFKRTCLQPKLELAKAFALLAQNYQFVKATDDPSLKAEVYYNFARVCHITGLLSRAEPLYRMVLELPVEIFKKNAAYNLHLMYLQSENHQLAKQAIEEHCRF